MEQKVTSFNEIRRVKRREGRAVFFAFMQERKALIKEKGKKVAETELLEKYKGKLNQKRKKVNFT